MRIAFVVQRYGLEVNGGAELEARLIAEHIAPYLQVEILTTCAIDYVTWQNHYAPGLDSVNGIPVRRFPTLTLRDIRAFDNYSLKIIDKPHSYFDEMQWMSLQGPNVPGLYEYIQEHQHEYDLFVFFTYLYATTFLGLQLVSSKSILFPTAHDETWIYFDLFRSVFHLPRALIFNSTEESLFVRKLFQNDYIPSTVLGVGIDPPQPVADVHILNEDYILYLGRIDESKGCRELIQAFLRYKDETHDSIKLVLIGTQAMALPSHPDILPMGFMKEERFAWLERAQLLVLPSSQESLSISTLEAWMMKVPVLVNGNTAVLKGHCLRSQGGLYYHHETEFIAALHELRSNAPLRAAMGLRGKEYVDRHYRWEVITKQYVTFFRQVYDIVYPHARLPV